MERNSILAGGNQLKLGLFGANCSNGRSYTTVPERWVASWENNVALARLADATGIECMVPIARWKGYGGATNVNGSSFESTNWASGLLSETRRVNVFATIHVPLHHPIIAAKQIATADHLGRGRFGVNIVCGWNEDEFKMFGIRKREHDDRYAEGAEWWQIVTRIWSGEGPFDFQGAYFQLEGVEGAPGPYGGQRPLMMNAGASPAGRAFAVRYSDMHFDGVEQRDAAPARIAETKRLAREQGRTIQVWTPVGIICRPTEREAKDYLRYCVDHADWGALHGLSELHARDPAASVGARGNAEPDRRVLARGATCLIGDPDQIADELRQLHDLGLDGLALNFVNYLDELPYFVQEVLPRLEAWGLRAPVGSPVDERLA